MSQKIPVETHHITLYYFFNHPCPLNDITQPTLPFSIKSDNNQGSIWQPHSYNLSTDFIPSIHQLFHRKPTAAIQSWALAKPLIRRINQSKLQLQLSKAAQQRLSDKQIPCQALGLYLDKLLHHNFTTGFGISTVELHLQTTDKQALTTQHLNEALHSLARFNRLQADNSTDTFSLGQLIRQLHDETSEAADKTRRVYTHCHAQVPDTIDSESCKQLADQLALHYTSDYHASNTSSAQQLQDFNNIIHSFAQEGSATLVKTDSNSPEIIKDYYNKVICPVQQPIQLLSEHLNHAMQQYTLISTNLIYNKLGKHKQAQQLHTIQEHLLNFKLNYFHPVISQINRHNRIQETLYQVKKINPQYQQLGNTIETLNELIRNKHQHRYCKLASFGIAAAGYLTSFSILKEAIEIMPEWPQLQKIAPQLSETLHHYHLTCSLAGSLLIAIIILVITYRHCKHHQPHAHGTSHELLEILHARHPLSK